MQGACVVTVLSLSPSQDFSVIISQAVSLLVSVGPVGQAKVFFYSYCFIVIHDWTWNCEAL